MLSIKKVELRIKTGQTDVSIMWLGGISCRVWGDISVRQLSKSEHRAPCHIQTLSQYDWKNYWKWCKTWIKQTWSLDWYESSPGAHHKSIFAHLRLIFSNVATFFSAANKRCSSNGQSASKSSHTSVTSASNSWKGEFFIWKNIFCNIIQNFELQL